MCRPPEEPRFNCASRLRNSASRLRNAQANEPPAPTSELYFRRVDLLEDEDEATPTLRLYSDYESVRRHAIPGVSESHPTMLESYRRCTYACCWRMSPHESWLGWKHYCSKSGGCAVQTTWRKLVHLHARLPGYNYHPRPAG